MQRCQPSNQGLSLVGREVRKVPGLLPAGSAGGAYLLVIFHELVFLLPVVVSFLHAVEDYDVTQHGRLHLAQGREEPGCCQPTSFCACPFPRSPKPCSRKESWEERGEGKPSKEARRIQCGDKSGARTRSGDEGQVRGRGPGQQPRVSPPRAGPC